MHLLSLYLLSGVAVEGLKLLIIRTLQLMIITHAYRMLHYVPNNITQVIQVNPSCRRVVANGPRCPTCDLGNILNPVIMPLWVPAGAELCHNPTYNDINAAVC